MRKKEEVMKQLFDLIQKDENIRVVLLNGSRVNPNAPKDIMQDYDVAVYLKKYNMSYKENREWINDFGELVICQQNDGENDYIFLMQFKDGVRIDLSFHDINLLEKDIEEDSLSEIIVDKGHLFTEPLIPSDKTYYVRKPSEQEYDATLNEAWWIQTYIAKGIWRDEYSYVKYMYDVILMDCVRKIINWYIALHHNWQVNPGKLGKWYKNFLPSDLYKELLQIYSKTSYEETWESLFKAGAFIEKMGTYVANECGYHYPYEDAHNVTEFIKRIKGLPSDAVDFN